MVPATSFLESPRAMYWSTQTAYRQSALDSIGTSGLAREWYLAEGSTGGDAAGAFETWILLENPTDHAASAKLYYQVPGGTELKGPEVTLEPNTRKTVNVADTVPDEYNVSTRVLADGPVVAERASYWNTAVFRQAGHGSIGVVAPSTEWCVAEGSTAQGVDVGFETWILVQNPGSESAHVELTYMTEQGPVDGPVFDLPRASRRSFSIADTLNNSWSVSTRVTSDRPVVVDGTLYFNAATEFRRSAHSSRGYTENAVE
jgi:hypothetical protein